MAEVEDCLLRFRDHYEAGARPFQWKLTRRDLDVLLAKLDRRLATYAEAA